MEILANLDGGWRHSIELLAVPQTGRIFHNCPLSAYCSVRIHVLMQLALRRRRYWLFPLTFHLCFGWHSRFSWCPLTWKLFARCSQENVNECGTRQLENLWMFWRLLYHTWYDKPMRMKKKIISDRFRLPMKSDFTRCRVCDEGSRKEHVRFRSWIFTSVKKFTGC